MNGLHLIGDLTGCRCDPQLLLDGERFRAKCLEMVAAAGLTTMDADLPHRSKAAASPAPWCSPSRTSRSTPGPSARG